MRTHRNNGSKIVWLVVSIALVIIAAVVAYIFLNQAYQNAVRYHDYEFAKYYLTGDYVYSENITDIHVYWANGTISLKNGSSGVVNINETGSITAEENRVHHFFDDEHTLYVEYCAAKLPQGYDINQKTLTLSVPEGVNITIQGNDPSIVYDDNFKAGNVDITLRMGDVSVNTIYAKDVSIYSRYGSVLATTMVSDSLSIRTRYGFIRVYNIDSDTLTLISESGSITSRMIKTKNAYVRTNTGKQNLNISSVIRLDCHSTSGHIALAFLDGFSAGLTFDTHTGVLTTGLDYYTYNGKYIFGDGVANVSVSTATGRLNIR